MLAEARARVEALPDDARVVDIGGWASPLERADVVIDLMPFETRGLYGESDRTLERFTAETWHVLDICGRVPWPFGDNEFDFAVCSHTLEDVRDPVWVCAELSRIAKAGYIEVPARVEEQTHGVHGPWVGWSHHHWLIDVVDNRLEFVFKPHLLHGRPEFWVPRDWTTNLPADRRVTTHYWKGTLGGGERVFYDPDELHEWLRAVGPRYGAPVGVLRQPPRADHGAGGRFASLRTALGRLSRRVRFSSSAD